MIKIEKNIPIPERRTGPKRKYPFCEMEVGDSFFVETPTRDKRGFCANIAGTGNTRHAPKRFVQRAEGDGLRVWRVE